ncbi:MAG: PaaI family thioesterase [Gammaproteobacteria bacterium]|nr:PaaI family thioesterase [Gammaproteobacteria bacterium]MDE2346355.1 PaaI family thioesterase [Gammaproteobacteria bacterium]
MGLLRLLAKLKFISETRRLELYPPFYKMRARILEASNGWRQIRIRLPLTAFSSNLSGDMFGGWQAALADPIAALSCARVFPGYSVWTRAMNIIFEKPGSTDLELRFAMSPEQEHSIAAELKTNGRATPTFEYGFYLADGSLCSRISNTVAIRPRGYAKTNAVQLDLNKL